MESSYQESPKRQTVCSGLSVVILRYSSEETKTRTFLGQAKPRLLLYHLESLPSVPENQVEVVKRRAARFVTNRYRNTSSVTDMLDYLEWETYEAKRTKPQLTVFYKIVHDLTRALH